jgi:hypothetical protein
MERIGIAGERAGAPIKVTAPLLEGRVSDPSGVGTPALCVKRRRGCIVAVEIEQVVGSGSELDGRGRGVVRVRIIGVDQGLARKISAVCAVIGVEEVFEAQVVV